MRSMQLVGRAALARHLTRKELSWRTKGRPTIRSRVPMHVLIGTFRRKRTTFPRLAKLSTTVLTKTTLKLARSTTESCPPYNSRRITSGTVDNTMVAYSDVNYYAPHTQAHTKLVLHARLVKAVTLTASTVTKSSTKGMDPTGLEGVEVPAAASSHGDVPYPN